MQLLYIWIDKYNSIAKQGFQFSSEYRFMFNQRDKTISVFKNSLFIPGYFNSISESQGPSNILEVTAIVGQNGAGKSALLDFICATFASKRHFGQYFPIMSDILIYKEEEALVVYHEEKVKVFNFDDASKDWKVNLDQPLRIYDRIEELLPSHRTASVLYAPNYDERILLKDIPDYELFNISHARQYYFDNLKIGYYDAQFKTSFKKVSSLRWHKIEEYKRQLKFVVYNNKNNLVNIPFSIDKTIDFSLQQSYTREKDFIDLMQLHNEICSPVNDIEFIRAKIALAICLPYILHEKKSNWKGNLNPKFLTSLRKTKNVFFSCIDFLKKHPLNYPPRMEKIFGSEIEVDNHKIPEIISYLNFIEKHFIQNNIRTHLDGKKLISDFQKNKVFNPYNIKIDIACAGELLDKYQHTLCEHVLDHVDFSWGSMSSGELSFLTLFARFFYFSYQVNNIERFRYVREVNINTLFIMIDEGETFFHPQWQKKYIYYLIPFLKNLFKDYRIQLILTSNSPMIASDFPKSNLILLKKELGKSIACDSLNQIKHTLGANIHTLLTDSFFMKDGLIGEFAKSQINNVIETLISGRSLTRTEMEQIKRFVANIGEPVIRNKLTELLYSHETNEWESKLRVKANEIDSLKNQMKIFEKRLKKMESSKRKKRKNE